MNIKYKRINIKDLVVGQKYYVICGVWSGKVTFTHSEQKGSRIYYNFTFGSANNWQNQVNIYSTKSNLRIYKEM